jgi:hypothetical protein
LDTLPARDSRANPGPKPLRRPPRPPQCWAYDPLTGELAILDCNGEHARYRVVEVPCDTGRSWELISVDERFGAFRTVHVGDHPSDDACDCPGFCWAEFCKHLHAVRDLLADGVLPANGSTEPLGSVAARETLDGSTDPLGSVAREGGAA